MNRWLQAMCCSCIGLNVVSCGPSEDAIEPEVGSAMEQGLPKFFNEEEFAGLVELGGGIDNVVLQYELDRTDGGVQVFNSCQDVGSIGDDQVVEHQFRLLRLLRINCRAAEIYFGSGHANESNFPALLSDALVSDFPAHAVPDIGGNALDLRDGMSMGQYEESLISAGDEGVSFDVTLTDGTEITYLIMARADHDGDGAEDWVVRLDWAIPDSFGEGSDLLVLSKPTPEDEIGIAWRF